MKGWDKPGYYSLVNIHSVFTTLLGDFLCHLMNKTKYGCLGVLSDGNKLFKLVPCYTFITLLNNSSTNIIINNLNKLDIKINSLPSKMICDLQHSSPQHNIFSNAGVYCIPCKNCKSKYIGEMYRNFHARMKEHKRDIRVSNLNNALLQNISQSNHNFNFNSSKMLVYIQNKRLRLIFEASSISFS